MIVVDMYIDASGLGIKKVDKGQIRIWNTADHPRHPKRANYKASFHVYGKRGRLNRAFKTVTLNDWPREARPIWDLLKAVMNQPKDKK